MKKYLVGIISLGLMASVLCSCGKEDTTVKADDMDNQTVVVFDDGKMQTSLVEEFKEDYYDVAELEEFIKESVDTYNKDNSSSVELDSVKLNDSKVNVVYNFSSVDEFAAYCTFDTTYREDFSSEEAISAKLIKGKDAKKDDLIPDKIEKYGKTKTKKKSKAIKDDYQVFIIDNTKGAIQDNLNIKVDGEIKFATNVVKVDKNTCSIAKLNEVTVVVFEP